jgi:CRISPR/Cas system-associated exonuclease Cas4 (RecB family)
MKYSSSHTEYFNKIGLEIPSATTILKILNKPSLIKWANYMGFKHQSVDDILETTSIIGSTVHMLVYSYLLEKQFILIESRHCTKNLLKMYFNSFLNWKKENNIIPEFMEKKMSSTKFGGTIDFYGIINGKKTILDFKTSKKIHSSMFLQLAAYCIMLEENNYEVEQVGILTINENKTTEKFITREELQKYIDTFKVLVDLFHLWFNINEKDNWGSIL